MADILEKSREHFLFLSDYIPDNIDNELFNFNSNEGEVTTRFHVISGKPLVNFTFSQELVDMFERKFKGSNVSYSLFLAFLEKRGLIIPPLKNPYQKIRQKINAMEEKFQALVLKMLEKESASIDLLVKKVPLIQRHG
ncbi:hypothetical protein [Sporosarcina sp. BP05]|uniref:hypothetical protein n=1 Tax=Sporosarcina sp. BP05 TaxID=2758726 RepID=UPI001644A133|nr:hypothetical protein [Sporosarcina sp. BP05]